MSGPPTLRVVGRRDPGDPLPDAAYLVALAGLPYMDHDSLSRVLEGRSAERAWRGIVAGELSAASVRPSWKAAAEQVDVAAVWDAHAADGVEVLAPGGDGYPDPLAGDHERPHVLFARGRLDAVDAPRRAGIIGTRRCTPYGREVAGELGRELAAAGVAVVSGLAAGIDGAAHEGALAAGSAAAPPVAVVGSGLDVVYPPRNARLWQRVGEAGLILGEAPLGARPEPWRFPARNRIIAALSDVLVVVESARAGGSMHTVRAALDRGVTVMAVPGSIRSPASAGTNLLLCEGVAPVTDIADVLVALDLERAGHLERRETRPVPTGHARTVLDALGWEPATLDLLLRRTGLSPGAAAVALSTLEQHGWVTNDAGWWRQIPR